LLSRSNLYPYQNRAVEWLKNHDNCAAWVFMGGGKTAAALTAFADLQATFDARRLLVVAPLRVARSVWSDEAQNWEHLQHLKVMPIIGTEAERRRALSTPADVYTLGRDNVQWLEELFIQGRKQVRRWPFDTVVLDEAQTFKSQSSKRWKSMNRLRRLFPRLVELTGTPSPNGLADVWAQLQLLDRGQRLGQTETAYRDRWFNKPDFGSYKYTIRGGWAEQQIHAALADIVLSLREADYFDLPPIIPNFVKVRLSAVQMTKYRRLERDYLFQTFTGKMVTAVSAGVCGNKLLQLANGAIYTDTAGGYEVFHDEKLKALVEILEGHDGPVIVCYSYKSDLPRMEAALAKAFGPAKTVEKMDTKASEDRWNRGETDVLLLHPASAGHGLNLQHSGSERIVWFGLTYNLEHIQQANARLAGGHRRGDRPLVIDYIVAEGTRDEDLLDVVLDLKAASQDRLLAALARLAKG